MTLLSITLIQKSYKAGNYISDAMLKSNSIVYAHMLVCAGTNKDIHQATTHNTVKGVSVYTLPTMVLGVSMSLVVIFHIFPLGYMVKLTSTLALLSLYQEIQSTFIV